MGVRFLGVCQYFPSLSLPLVSSSTPLDYKDPCQSLWKGRLTKTLHKADLVADDCSKWPNVLLDSFVC